MSNKEYWAEVNIDNAFCKIPLSVALRLELLCKYIQVQTACNVLSLPVIYQAKHGTFYPVIAGSHYPTISVAPIQKTSVVISQDILEDYWVEHTLTMSSHNRYDIGLIAQAPFEQLYANFPVLIAEVTKVFSFLLYKELAECVGQLDTTLYLQSPDVACLTTLISTPKPEEKSMNLYTYKEPNTTVAVTNEVSYGVDGETLIAGLHYLAAIKGKRTADNSQIRSSAVAEVSVHSRIMHIPVIAVKPGQAIKFVYEGAHQWGFVVSVEPSSKHEQDVRVRVLATNNNIYTFEIAQEFYVAIVPEYKDVFPATLRKKAFVDTLLVMAHIFRARNEYGKDLHYSAVAVYVLMENSKLIGLERTNELLDVLMVKYLMQ